MGLKVKPPTTTPVPPTPRFPERPPSPPPAPRPIPPGGVYRECDG